MDDGRLNTLGIEFAFEESIAALAVVDPEASSREQIKAMMAALPYPSVKTRQRVAEKIHQRYVDPREDVRPVRLAELIPTVPSRKVRRELLVYQLSRVDGVPAALARDIFYPYFVHCALPKGYTDASFRRANTGTLLETDRFVSTTFCTEFAKRAWGFNSPRSVGIGLRILRDGRILDSTFVHAGSQRVLGWIPTFRGISVATFVYALYAEYGDELTVGVPLDRIHNSTCARLFLLNPIAVDSLIETTRHLAGGKLAGRGSSRRLSLAPLSGGEQLGLFLGLANEED